MSRKKHLGVKGIAVALFAAACAVAAVPAAAQGIFVSVTSDNSTGFLDVLNPLTGKLTQIGSTKNGTSLVCLNGLAMMPNGQLFGSDYSGNIYQVNTSNGALTKVGTMNMTSPNLNVGITATGSGNMFGLGLNSNTSTDTLFSVNSKTGAATQVGSNNGTGMLLNGNIAGGTGNTLYATQGGGSYGNGFYSINSTTGAATLLSSQNDGSVYGLGMYNGVMYGENTTGSIYSFNLATGAATLVSSYSTTNGWINASASVANTPEPGAIAMLIGTALSGAQFYRRSRKRVRPAA